jgi:hypothetical protein
MSSVCFRWVVEQAGQAVDTWCGAASPLDLFDDRVEHRLNNRGVVAPAINRLQHDVGFTGQVDDRVLKTLCWQMARPDAVQFAHVHRSDPVNCAAHSAPGADR